MSKITYQVLTPMSGEYEHDYDLVRFWRFDRLMFACGVFYDIVGTSPQDGEHREVSKVLKMANTILDEELAEWDDDDYEDEE